MQQTLINSKREAEWGKRKKAIDLIRFPLFPPTMAIAAIRGVIVLTSTELNE